jgi:hypothetical protein
MTFGATQLSLACEGEEFAQTPEELAVAPTFLDEGVRAEVESNAIVMEPSVVLTVIAPVADELALVDASASPETSASAEPAAETTPATEVAASLSRGGQSEQVAEEQEPQYTGAAVSETEGNAIVWYPDVEITIAAAAVIAEGGVDE